MIDWTKPCETDEDPPRPVRVLATDLKSQYRVACVVTNHLGNDNVLFSNMDGFVLGGPHLRNVPPPKPEPVLREGWLNLYSDAGIRPTMQDSEREANGIAREGRVECRRITWMSDGSPVPSEASGEGHTNCWANYNSMTADRDHWKAKAEALQNQTGYTPSFIFKYAGNGRCDGPIIRTEEDFKRLEDKAEALQAEVDGWWKWEVEIATPRISKLGRMYDELQAEVERMKPVVDAAVAYVQAMESSFATVSAYADLEKTVRTYQSKQAPAEPVKNCTTCWFCTPIQVGAPCVKCHDASEWRNRHD